MFWALIIPAHLMVLREEGLLTDVGAWRKFFRYSMGRVGLIRKLVLPWADYFRPDFHPWDHDNSRFLGDIERLAQTYAAPLKAAA